MGNERSKSRRAAREKVLSSFLEQMESPARRKSAPSPSPASRPTEDRRRVVRTPGRASSPAAVPAGAPQGSSDALLDGKYRLGRLCGRGGVGEVYEAVHAVIGMRVAIKLIRREWAGDSELAARFLQEARAAAAVGHPGIVHVHDVGTTPEGRTYLVMELLEGEDLEKVLRRRSRLPPAEIVPVLCDALDALDAAHSKGIVHRDLKPENIFLVAGPRRRTAVRILDFGIARLAGAPETASRLTLPGTVMGTPYYMSPEQVAGAATIDGGADIYALGIVLFEALTGKLPFAGKNVQETLCEVLEAPFPSARELCPEIPEELERVIRKATARKREERFREAAAFAAALEPFRELRCSRPPAAPARAAEGPGPASEVTPQPVVVSRTVPTVAVRSATGPVAAPTPAREAVAPAGDTAGAAAPAGRGGVPRRRRALIGAIAAGAAILVTVAVAFHFVPGGGTSSREPAATGEEGAGSGQVRVRVRGVPPGATLRFDGRIVDEDFLVPASADIHKLEVTADGRAPIVRAVVAGVDVTVDLDVVPPVPAGLTPGQRGDGLGADGGGAF
ncbi:MAG: serine/threonine protein kinase [Deltaproteobacteria bacterium]|nr:serine/threonine protein kinase [Deltaproteobacteria bacterium]